MRSCDAESSDSDLATDSDEHGHSSRPPMSRSRSGFLYPMMVDSPEETVPPVMMPESPHETALVPQALDLNALPDPKGHEDSIGK